MTENTNTELATINTATGEVVSVQRAANQGEYAPYTSIVAETHEDRLEVLKAVMNSTPVKKSLGKKIAVRDVIVEPVVLEDRVTKEPREQPHMYLVLEDGSAIDAYSPPLYRDVMRIINILGEPSSWKAPATLKIEEQSGKNGDFYTVKIA